MSNVQGNDNSMQNGRILGEHGLRQRVDQARDLVDSVRDKAEMTFREKPYLLPIAAGAVGVGVGMLLGSKILRFVAFTAIGTILSEALGGEIKRMSKDFIEDLQTRLGEGDETT